MNKHNVFPVYSPYSHPILAWLRKKYFNIAYRNIHLSFSSDEIPEFTIDVGNQTVVISAEPMRMYGRRSASVLTLEPQTNMTRCGHYKRLSWCILASR
jgi:hypothetical protein